MDNSTKILQNLSIFGIVNNASPCE